MSFMNDLWNEGKEYSCLQNYEMIRMLGKGSVGRVILCSREGKAYAVKIGGPWKYLKREAEMLRELSLTNVPRVYEMEKSNKDNDQGCFVMDYLYGETLEDRMKLFPGGMSCKNADLIAGEILELLKELHGSGQPVVHLDLKPTNLILNQKSEISLIDFGAASHVGEEGEFLAGTIGFAAPEQFWKGSHARCSSDVYSFAMIYLYLVTGQDPSKPPFPGGDVLLQTAPLGKRKKAFLKRCLALQPEERPYDALQVMESWKNMSQNMLFRNKIPIVYEKSVWRSNWKNSEEVSTEYFDFS